MNNTTRLIKHNKTNQRLLRPIWLCSIALLTSCAGLQNGNSGLYQPTPWVLEQNRNRLASIEALLQSDQREEAKSNADSINPNELSIEQNAQLNLLYGQIMLSFGDAEQASRKLSQIQPEQLSLPDQIKYFQAKALAFSSIGDFLNSAKARIDLEPLINVANVQNQNHRLIIENLTLLPDSVLRQTQQQALTPLAEWLELASLLKTKNQNPESLNNAIMQWRSTYPSHPGNANFLQNLQKSLTDAASQKKTIALFLPESGVYAEAGKAIRAGIMAAYNHDTNNLARPTLQFYNSEKLTGAALYNQAINQGANLIIGPLDKNKIQNLATSVQFTIPVLALNHIQGLQQANLFQFGLSPMDDANQITSKAWLDGHRNAMVLTPDNETGSRIAKFLVDSWQRKGGKVTIKRSYNPKNSNFSFITKKILSLNGSLNKSTANAKAQRAPRKAIDVVLLSAYSDEARLINQEIQSSQAGAVAVYAMPNAYSGRTNASADSKLNQVSFCDAPWLFDKAYTGDLSMQTLQPTWSAFSNQYYRLIAMGIDAYYLAGQLNNLRNTPYYGATGKLSLTENQRVQRELVCAKFITGQPEIRGYLGSAN